MTFCRTLFMWWLKNACLKGQVNPEKSFLVFLSSDRLSEKMKVSKRKCTEILNIYWVIKVSILSFVSFVSLWRHSCLNWKLNKSVNTKKFNTPIFGNLHSFRWSIWCDSFQKEVCQILEYLLVYSGFDLGSCDVTASQDSMLKP